MLSVLVFAATRSERLVPDHGITARDWVVAAVVFVAGIVVGRALKAFLVRAIRRRDSERAAAEAVGRVVGSVAVLGGLIYGLSVVGVRLGPLVGALGIGGLAIAFAAQTILANFLGSIILQVRRPFRRGDQIETAGCEGTVEDVNFRTVVLRTFDGERVLVPCSQVLSGPITNHTTLGRRRTTLEVGVSYEADLERARTVVLAAVESVEGVLQKPSAEVWVEKFDESSVALAVRFWHAPDIATLWRVRSHVALAVKRALDDARIEIPFPQRVVHVRGTDAPAPEGLDERTRLDTASADTASADGAQGADGVPAADGAQTADPEEHTRQ